MDTSRMGRGRSLAAGGGAVLIASLFINWVAGQDAFQAFNVVDILLLIIGLAALAFGLAPAVGAEARMPRNTPWILAALALAAFGWATGFEFEVSGDFGVWIAIFSSLAVAYGAAEVAGCPALPGLDGTARPAAASPPPPPAPPVPPPPAPPPPPSVPAE